MTDSKSHLSSAYNQVIFFLPASVECCLKHVNFHSRTVTTSKTQTNSHILWAFTRQSYGKLHKLLTVLSSERLLSRLLCLAAQVVDPWSAAVSCWDLSSIMDDGVTSMSSDWWAWLPDWRSCRRGSSNATTQEPYDYRERCCRLVIRRGRLRWLDMWHVQITAKSKCCTRTAAERIKTKADMEAW